MNEKSYSVTFRSFKSYTIVSLSCVQSQWSERNYCINCTAFNIVDKLVFFLLIDVF